MSLGQGIRGLARGNCGHASNAARTRAPRLQGPPAARLRPAWQARAPFSPGGFTLLELLVVLAVIGVVLMAALPRFAGTGEAYLKTDASRLCSLLRFVDDASATRKLYYKVSFDIPAGEIRVQRSSDGVEYEAEPDPNARGLRLREGVAIEDVVVQELGKVNTGTAQVVFAPVGSTDAFAVHLASSGRRMTVAFNPYSAEARMEDGYVDP